jgi:hypothetical protein
MPRYLLAQPVLPLISSSMVLIGIQPFAFKKILILVAALFCLSSAICFADSLFMSLHSTPSIRRLNHVRPILPVSERTVQPSSDAYQWLGGRLARDSGWILQGNCLLDPTINCLAGP